MVAVFSRKWSTAECRWHIREKVALAIVEALRKFRHFLLGSSFVVRSDHESLQWLLDSKSGRLGRWALLLSEFLPFKIIHRSGTKHCNVDALTRTFADSELLPDRCFPLAATFPRCLLSRDELLIAQAPLKDSYKAIDKVEVCHRLFGLRINGRWRPFLPPPI